jgi:branched-chain amino acid transport system ATP-binding protein
MSTPTLQVDDLHTYYGDSYVLQGVDLEVPAGGVSCLLGRNGMGKTTLMHTVAGLIQPRRGTIRHEGEDVTGRRPHELSRGGFALVPQGRRIFGSLNVEENLMLCTSRLSGHRPTDGGWDLQRVYERFPNLANRRRNSGNALSGGEQQMLAIGRGLLRNPRLLLMDEPSEGLAPSVIEDIKHIVLDIKASGLSTLLVEQRLDFALEVADTIYVLSSGLVVWHGTPAELQAEQEVMDVHLGV